MATSYRSSFHGIGIPIPSIFSSNNLTAQGTAGANTNSEYEESNFDLDVTPGTGNVTDSNGRSRGSFMASGDSGLGSDAYIDATIVQPGYPDQTAAYTITPDSGTDYGYTLPNVVTGVGTVVHTTSSDGYRSPRAIFTKDLTHVCVAEDWSSNSVVSFTSTDGTSGWTANTIYTPTTAFSTTYLPSPEIIQLDDGRLLCFSIEMINSLDSSSYLRIDFSTDNGVTWDLYGRRLIPFIGIATIVYDQLRVVFDSLTRTITLMVRVFLAGSYYAYHYSSSDIGSTWTECQYLTDVASHSIVSSNGLIIYNYIPSVGSAYIITCHKVGGAYTFTQKSAITQAQTSTYITTCITPANVLIAFSRSITDLSLTHQWISHNYGITWGSVQDSYPATSSNEYRVWDDHIGSNTFVSGIKFNDAYWVFGSIYIVGNTVSSSLNYSIQFMRMGQIENITRRDPMTSALYLPYDFPAVRGWTSAGTAPQTVTSVLSQTVLKGEVTAGTFRNYYQALSGTIYSYTVHAVVRCSSGGSTTSDECVINLIGKNQSTTTNFDFKIRISSTQIRCYDEKAFANVGSAVSASGTIEILACVDGDSSVASVWWRPYTSGTSGRMTWQNIISNQILDTAVYATAPVIYFGSLAGGAVTTAYWYMFGVSNGYYDRFADGFSSSDLIGIPIATSVSSISTDVAIWGKGYFSTGDTFRIDDISRTGVDRALDISTYPSPRLGYSADPSSFYSYLVFDAGATTRIGDMIGLAIKESNCLSYTLETWDGAAWVNQMSLSMAQLVATGWTRSSTSDTWFRPNAANSNRRYYRQDELVGEKISIFDSTGYDIGATITANTEGQFSTSSGVRQMAFQISPTLLNGTLTTLGTSTTTVGSLTLIYKDAVIVGTQTASSRYYRITIERFGSNLSVGKIIPLRMSLLARQSDAGGQYTYNSNDEVTTLPYGFDRARRLAPSGRSWRFPFRQLIGAAYKHNGGGVVNGVGITGSTLRATTDNNLDQFVSVIETAGQSTPIVFIAQLDVTADLTTAVTLYGKNKWMYGRVEDSITATMGRGYRYGDKSKYDVDFSIKEIV